MEKERLTGLKFFKVDNYERGCDIVAFRKEDVTKSGDLFIVNINNKEFKFYEDYPVRYAQLIEDEEETYIKLDGEVFYIKENELSLAEYELIEIKGRN